MFIENITKMPNIKNLILGICVCVFVCVCVFYVFNEWAQKQAKNTIYFYQIKASGGQIVFSRKKEVVETVRVQRS